MKYLLDTCLISEVIRPTPAATVIAWLDARDEDSLYLSVLTLGELQKGISKLTDAGKKQRLQTWLENDLGPRFQGRVLAIDEEIALTWGAIQGEAERQGNRQPVVDSLIAATAMAHNLTLVTRNTSDFDRCSVRLFNPWPDS